MEPLDHVSGQACGVHSGNEAPSTGTSEIAGRGCALIPKNRDCSVATPLLKDPFEKLDCSGSFFLFHRPEHAIQMVRPWKIHLSPSTVLGKREIEGANSCSTIMAKLEGGPHLLLLQLS
ncbi:Hypothetical predicted protein [Olea europaea subsp. europaea]|uniref:Uncharacterized protein n=1 Tax=Olea europaea subsp. europaea TaxID=158383 RepID=A0A8S0QT69_OLEEU|nr:Hypothetical predicted protein [Olea europaea subsp. europaea]